MGRSAWEMDRERAQKSFEEFWRRQLSRELPQSGFEPDPEAPRCLDACHKPPTHLHVPMGQRYRHICPGCGVETVLRASEASF